MEEMQRKLRDELDAIKQSWGARLGSGPVGPLYNFSRLAPFQRVAPGTSRNASRVETLYEHLQEEISAWQAQVGADEHLVVLFMTTGGDVFQVGSIGYRVPDLLVIEGVDASNQRSRILAPAGTAQLLMKIMTSSPDTAQPATDFEFSGPQGTR